MTRHSTSGYLSFVISDTLDAASPKISNCLITADYIKALSLNSVSLTFIVCKILDG